MTFLLASITPVIIFLYLIYQRDNFKEPKSMLIKCFTGGFLVFIIAFIIETFLELGIKQIEPPFLSSLFKAFIGASLPEEGAKFCVLYWIVWKSKDLDEEYDGIVYAVFVSLGMALLENIEYIYANGLQVALIRGVLSVPGHGFFAVQMGYFLSKARFGKIEDQKNNLILSLMVPFLFHGAFDFCLLFIGEEATVNTGLVALLLIMFTIIVIYLWRLGLKDIQKLTENSKLRFQKAGYNSISTHSHINYMESSNKIESINTMESNNYTQEDPNESFKQADSLETEEIKEQEELPEEISNDKLGVVFIVLCVLIPLVGLIIYFNQKNKFPNKANTAARSAGIGLALNFALQLLIK